MNKRLLELAIEALEHRKTAIDEEINRLRRGNRGRPLGNTPRSTTGRKRTAAQKKAQSIAMKAYWAKKRGESRASGAGRRNRARASAA